jgi:segregation and condensation protein B
MPPLNLRSAVEALLFSSDQPLTLALLAEALEAPAEEISAALQVIGEDYAAREAGVRLREMAGGWLFTTAPDQHEWVTRMLRGKRKTRLSRAALETMAIIAYKQPVTKSEVEAIRGVDASGVLATLLERNLVTIKGRSTVVGRPLLYGTTPEFLNYFGLRDIAELPRPEELRALVAAREPEQLEMMELDPGTGMPLALVGADTGLLEVSPSDGEATVPEALQDDALRTAPDAKRQRTSFSLADADAAIAQANAARAEAAMAIEQGGAPAGGALAGAGDLAEVSDDGEGEGYDDDEFEDDDEDDEFDDAYDEDEDEDADDAGQEGESPRRPVPLDEPRGR